MNPFSTPRRDIILVVFMSLVCLGLAIIPTGFEDRQPKNSHLARGRVIKVDDSDVYRALIVKTGNQLLTTELLSGPFKGQTIAVDNSLTGKMEMDEVYQPGSEIMVEYAVIMGKARRAVARGHYRLRLELILLLLFVVALIGVAGWTGCKALLSFVFAALMIWKVMLPLFLKGKDPICVALLAVGGLTAVVCFLVGGITRKGWVAFIGAFSGLLLACGLAHIFTGYFKVHGAVRPFAETLLYSGFDFLDLNRIFVASVFVACSGAVMDLSMDIAASMHEIKVKKPDIGMWELIGSGMAVGRSVVGTMTTTLLLAYSGSTITMLMLFMGRGIPLMNMLNKGFVAAEILNTMVGSFGLVTVAPFTALAGGLLFHLEFSFAFNEWKLPIPRLSKQTQPNSGGRARTLCVP